MISKLGNIELSPWHDHPSGLVRFVISYGIGGKTMHANIAVCLHIEQSKVKHVRFHRPIFAYDALYNPGNQELDLSIEEAKEDVDRFLVRMNKLMAFT